MTAEVNAQRGIPRRALRATVFLILIQCALLAYPSASWGIPGLLGAIAISRIWTMRQGWSLTFPILWNSLFLAVLFAIKFTIAPAQYTTDAPFINTELAHEIGCWLVAVQLLVLHDPGSSQRIPAKLGALACLVALCAGDVRLHSLSRVTMLVLMLLFVVALGWFSHTSREWIRMDPKRRMRRAILTMTILVGVIPSVFAAQAWHQHERDLEMLLIQMMKALDGGPTDLRLISRSSMTEISNGRMFNPETPVLKVRQTLPEPVYLRGWCYDEFLQSNWTLTRPRTQSNPRISQLRNEGGRLHFPGMSNNLRNVEPISSQISTQSGPWPAGVPIFTLRPAIAAPWNRVEVEYFDKTEPLPYIPWETAALEMPVSQLNTDERRNLSLIEDNLPDRLVAYCQSTNPGDPPPTAENPFLQLPDAMDFQVRQISEDLLRGATSDQERIRRLEQFFLSNFQYELGFEPPARQDPIAYFLVHRPPAHCEYFATAAVLLLRMGGVPARYVTGYVPSEYNPDGFWIARRKDRHAWAEAYDREAGRWVNVEATPSNGLPERRTSNWQTVWSERWRIWTDELIRRFQELGFLSALGHILQTMIARVILGVTFLIAWLALVRKYRHSGNQTRSDHTGNHLGSSQLAELNQLLSRHGLERRTGETILQFGDRISQTPAAESLLPVAEWMGLYGVIRYDEESADEQVRQLEDRWQQIHRK